MHYLVDARFGRFGKEVLGQHFFAPHDAVGCVRAFRCTALPVMNVGVNDHAGVSLSVMFDLTSYQQQRHE